MICAKRPDAGESVRLDREIRAMLRDSVDGRIAMTCVEAPRANFRTERGRTAIPSLASASAIKISALMQSYLQVNENPHRRISASNTCRIDVTGATSRGGDDSSFNSMACRLRGRIESGARAATGSSSG